MVLPEFEPLAQRTYVYDVYGNEIAVYETREHPADQATPTSRQRSSRRSSPSRTTSSSATTASTCAASSARRCRTSRPTRRSRALDDHAAGGQERVPRRARTRRPLQGAADPLRPHARKEMTKEQILERYLNTVFFGNNAYGIQAAAETYFGKTAAELTFIEAAFLAGLVRSPSGYDPIRARAQPGPVGCRCSIGSSTRAISPSPRPRRSRRDRTPSCCPSGSKTIPTRTNVRTYFTEALREYLLDTLDHPRRRRRGAVQPAVPRRPADPHHARSEPAGAGRGAARRAAGQPAGLRRGDRVARLGDRRDPGDGRRAGLQANEARSNMALAPRQTGSSIKFFILAAAVQAGAQPNDMIDGTRAVHAAEPRRTRAEPFVINDAASPAASTRSRARRGRRSTARSLACRRSSA